MGNAKRLEHPGLFTLKTLDIMDSPLIVVFAMVLKNNPNFPRPRTSVGGMGGLGPVLGHVRTGLEVT